MLAGLVLDVRGLVGQPARRGVDALAARPRARAVTGCCASQSICEVGVELAQLVGDREVAPGVAEPDRRGEVERPLAAGAAPRDPACGPVGRGLHRVDELLDQVVDADRVAGVRAVPDALEQDQRRRRSARRAAAPIVGRADLVVGAVDDHAPGTAPARTAARAASPRRRAGPAARRWCRPASAAAISEAPADAVLDLLGRVRLVEHLAEEEAEEVVVAALEPVVLGCTSPSPRWCRAARRTRAARAPGSAPANPQDGAMATSPLTRSGCSAATCTDHATPQESATSTAWSVAGRVEDGERVGGVLSVGVRRRARPGGRSARAPAVEGDDAEVPGQVGRPATFQQPGVRRSTRSASAARVGRSAPWTS